MLLTLIWLAMAGAAWLILPASENPASGGAMQTVMAVVAVGLPVALIWLAALTARHLRLLREENRRLRAALRAPQTPEAGETVAHDEARHAALAERVESLAQSQRKVEAALARLNAINTRPGPAARSGEPTARTARQPEPVQAAEQATLALEEPAPRSAPIPPEEYIRALNFPADAEDRAGFRALALARRDHEAAALLRSAEDVLTLLAEDGIYMDDLTPDRARPELWRRFARGERGGAVAELGGVRDRESLARAAGRMRQDPVFRDCAHHFLRRFDSALARFEELASDAEIAALSDTRSARAFMLLGRVSGSFD